MEFEQLRELHHWLPWKPNPEYEQTDDDIDDIDRTVPFEDISKFLFAVSEDQAKLLLVQNFINFLGFNPHLFECCIPTDSDAKTHTAIRNFDIISKTLNDTLFKSQEFSPLCFKCNVWTNDKISFVKNIFSQAVKIFPSEHRVLISFMWLKFLQDIALNCDNKSETVDSVKKFAKNMLKETENRNCLLLWFEYIKIESLSGSKNKSKKTFEMLLASSTNAIATGSISMNEIWYFTRSYIDFCINSLSFDPQLFSHNEIIWILIHISCKERYVPYNNESIKPTLILKAVAGFKSYLNEEINTTNTSFKLCYCLNPCGYSFLDCARCFAYLQYFTQGLDSAVQVLKDVTKIVEDKIDVTSKRCDIHFLKDCFK